MPGISIAPPPTAPGSTAVPTFGGNTPSVTGYNAAISNLNNAVGLAGNTTSGQVNALGTQLNNSLANLQQGLTNTGLGNSTVAQSAKAAPQEVYNQGILNAQNQGALLQEGALGNLANMEAGAGMNLNQAGYGLPKNQVVVPGIQSGGQAGNPGIQQGGGQPQQQMPTMNPNLAAQLSALGYNVNQNSGQVSPPDQTQQPTTDPYMDNTDMSLINSSNLIPPDVSGGGDYTGGTSTSGLTDQYNDYLSGQGDVNA